MRPANPARGEAAILVGGERVVLRPSFEALVAAEEEVGSLFALVERAADGRLALSEMARALHFLSSSRARNRRASTTKRFAALACRTSGGWRLISPVSGMIVWNGAAGHWLHWTGDALADGF